MVSEGYGLLKAELLNDNRLAERLMQPYREVKMDVVNFYASGLEARTPLLVTAARKLEVAAQDQAGGWRAN